MSKPCNYKPVYFVRELRAYQTGCGFEVYRDTNSNECQYCGKTISYLSNDDPSLDKLRRIMAKMEEFEKWLSRQ